MTGTPNRHSLVEKIIAALLSFGALNASGLPTGMTVQSGSASSSTSGSQLTVTTTSPNTFLNWQSFNIGAGETTLFQEPSASSIVWNRINDPNPSQIFGTLQANGVVVLLNSSGFYFGPNSFVSAAGLIVSTANYLPPENTGGAWEFNGAPPLASIVNYGQIQVGQGGSAFLIANQIGNYGTISAPGGSVGLAAGQTVLLSERPDGRGMSMQVTLPAGSVNNSGKLIADAGTIEMDAQVVNQDGLLQANSVQNQNGVISLVASDQLNLGSASQIDANGDNSAAGSAGGSVTLQSGNSFSDTTGGTLSVTGGSHGGNGGSVEISAPDMTAINSQIDGSAQPGWVGGSLLIDPDYIVLNSSSGGTTTQNGYSILNLNVNSAFTGFSAVTLQANYDITLAAGTLWDLSGSTGSGSGQVTLQAGGNIIFGNSSEIFDANAWSLALDAGYNFGAGAVQINSHADNGSIYLCNASHSGNLSGFNTAWTPLTGGGAIQLANGSIDMTAAGDILVGSRGTGSTPYGFVVTSGSGDITVHALAGNIGTGSFAQGYSADNGFSDSQVGGISTEGTGNLSLTAGQNIFSVLPGKTSYSYNGHSYSPNNGNDFMTAGAGAYGSGNVSIVAGGNVTGAYTVANGVGSLFAGVLMDANGNPLTDSSGNYLLGTTGSAGTDPSIPNLALNLINGGWNVTAAQNIILQEVRNPLGGIYQGVFNYGAGDYVNLTAGNLVQLGISSASQLPRTATVPIIYPGILNILAGAGGVNFIGDGSSTFDQLILFPSPQGSLDITTTDGGSLNGVLPSSAGLPQIFNLVVSDSGRNRYVSSSSFGPNDHAAVPVHLDSPTPIDLNIAGNMDLFMLYAPEAATINVGGDMINSRFQGMNLSSDPTLSLQVPVMQVDGTVGTATVTPGVSTINVAGSIINRSAFTSVDLNQVNGAVAPDFSQLRYAILPGNISLGTLLSSFYYDPSTGTLTYQNISGLSLATVLQLLENVTVQVYVDGQPQWLDPPYDTLPRTTTVSVLNDADAQALLAAYNADNAQYGAIPKNANSFGYIVGGGGEFDVNAQNIDLGTSLGIQSLGVGLYRVGSAYPLVSQAGITQGADINVTVANNLDLLSSSIASVDGGNINVNAGNEINLGSPTFTPNTQAARGIFSTTGDVAVYANSDINVNGSRIASYDGGNVTVESYNGDINAGSGGEGSVVVNSFYVDPSTLEVYSSSPRLPGSGILATTFPQPTSAFPEPARSVGNILVEAPNGNVNANAGGITQIAFNGTGNSASYGLFTDIVDAYLAGHSSLQQILASFAQLYGHSISLNQFEQLYAGHHASTGGMVDVLAGYQYQDGQGTPLTAAGLGSGNPVLISPNDNIDASGSGVIGDTVDLRASGDIIGVIFARGNLDVNAQQNVQVSALSEGTASISGASLGSSTVIGIGGVDVSGDSSGASLLSNNSISGGSGAQTGFSQGTAANSASTGEQNNDALASAVTSSDQDDDKKKKKKQIPLSQRTGRVTVILPAKTKS